MRLSDRLKNQSGREVLDLKSSIVNIFLRSIFFEKQEINAFKQLYSQIVLVYSEIRKKLILRFSISLERFIFAALIFNTLILKEMTKAELVAEISTDRNRKTVALQAVEAAMKVIKTLWHDGKCLSAWIRFFHR